MKRKGKLWDLETGEEILHPISWDEQTGLFEAFQVNAWGRIKTDSQGDKLTYTAIGKIKWVPEQIKLTHQRVSHWGAKCTLCTRDANWSVGDETPLPVMTGMLNGKGVEFLRARTVGIRYYCDFCYKAPRILDARGEVMETIDDAGGVRPQWHS